MSIRLVTQELEAKLTGKPGGFFSKPAGKLERKSYRDGGERLKISVRNLKTSAHSNAVIQADGTEIAQIQIIAGAGRFDTETEDSGAPPVLREGLVIEVLIDGEPILKGKLYVD